MFDYQAIKLLINSENRFRSFNSGAGIFNRGTIKVRNDSEDEEEEDDDEEDSGSAMDEFELEQESKKWIVQKYITNPLLY